jgi:hypothetical protein
MLDEDSRRKKESIAISRKMLVSIYGVLTKNELYDDYKEGVLMSSI